MSADSGIVYASRIDGHRAAYLDILGSALNLEPVWGKVSVAMLLRLASARRLLLSTLDDDMILFFFIVAVRAVIGRPTVALFLRAQKCFERGRWYYGPKRMVFKGLRFVPKLTIVSITPFSVAPELAEVAHLGLHDPQYWDVVPVGEGMVVPPPTDLSKEILRLAGNRQVVCAMGTLSENKGLAFLAAAVERSPSLAGRVLVVAAGRVDADAQAITNRISRAGGLVVGRVLSDQELVSLYGVSDVVWACYDPRYDQASGIFGRAMQYTVPCIVRAGSTVHRYALMEQVRHYSVSFGDLTGLAALLSTVRKRVVDDHASNGKCSEHRSQFVSAVSIALAGQRPTKRWEVDPARDAGE